MLLLHGPGFPPGPPPGLALLHDPPELLHLALGHLQLVLGRALLERLVVVVACFVVVVIVVGPSSDAAVGGGGRSACKKEKTENVTHSTIRIYKLMERKKKRSFTGFCGR